MANPAKKFRELVQQANPGAAVIERGRNFIKHQIGNKEILDISLGPIHFGSQNDQEIDTAWVPGDPVLDAPWLQAMKLANFNVYAGPGNPNFSSGQIIRYVHPASGADVAFQPQQLQWTNDLNQIQAVANPQDVPFSIDDDKLVYAGAFGSGLDLTWEVQPARLSKQFFIPSLVALPTPNATIISGGNPVLRLRFIFAPSSGIDIYINGELWTRPNNQNFDTTEPIEFRLASTGETLWHFNRAVVYDADGNELFPIQRVRRSGNSLFVEVRVPWEWLQTAIFPVVIDPTIDDSVGSGANDAEERDSETGFSSTTTSIRASASTTSSSRYNSGTRFQNGPAQGVVINVAYATFQARNTSNDDPRIDLDFENVDAANDYTTTADVTTRTGNTTGNPVSYIDTGVGTGDVNTPSLVAPLQALVNRTGYGGIINLLWMGKDDAAAAFSIDSFELSSSECARLHIEYTAGVDVTPNPAVAKAVSINPTVRLGSLSLTPTPAATAAVSVNPTVQLGSISITPAAATAVATGVDPTVDEGGGLNITPNPATAVAMTTNPTVQLGSISITPNAASAASNITNPAVQLGSISITPTPAAAAAVSVNPTVRLGSISITPAAAAAKTVAVDPIATPLLAISGAVSVNPTVQLGSLSITPVSATASAAAVNPTVRLGSISITPTAAQAGADSANPTVVLGSLSITPAAATAVAIGIDPTVDEGGGLNITPNPATAVAMTTNPTVQLGSISITPNAASAASNITNPAVQLGSISITPTPAAAAAVSVNPTIQLGSISITPNAVLAVASIANPTVQLGSISITPTPAAAVAATTNPTVLEGEEIQVFPNPAIAGADTSGPIIFYSSVSFTPAPAILAISTTDPIVFIGAGQATKPAPALARTESGGPVFGISVSPTPAVLATSVTDPELFFNSVDFTPDVAIAKTLSSIGFAVTVYRINRPNLITRTEIGFQVGEQTNLAFSVEPLTILGMSISVVEVVNNEFV